MLLAINTSSQNCALASLNKLDLPGKKVLSEITWQSQADESEKLLIKIRDLLEKHHLQFSDLTSLFVISGPGSYTRLRIGVTIVNALAYSLNLPVYSLDLFNFYRLRYQNNVQSHSQKSVILINAGGDKVYFCPFTPQKKITINQIEILSLAEISPKASRFFGELTSAQLKKISSAKTIWFPEKKLLSFGSTLLKLDFNQLFPQKLIIPFYFRPPLITPPKAN